MILLTGSSREKIIEQNWALEAGFVDISRNTLDDELIAFAHVPRYAVPRLARSHDIIGTVTAQAAAWTGLSEGTPVIGGAADLIASALGAG
jgi:xylulokinase